MRNPFVRREDKHTNQLLWEILEELEATNCLLRKILAIEQAAPHAPPALVMGKIVLGTPVPQ